MNEPFNSVKLICDDNIVNIKCDQQDDDQQSCFGDDHQFPSPALSMDSEDARKLTASRTVSLRVNSSPDVITNVDPLSMSYTPPKTAVSYRLTSRSFGSGRLYHSMTGMDKKGGKFYSKFYSGDDPNIEKVLQAVKGDQAVVTDLRDKKRRRTLVLTRNKDQKFGFTVQTYTFLRSRTNVLEQVTYVDYVDLNSPANEAGLRAGDVIISINGDPVRCHKHDSLVDFIGQLDCMRLVVLFQNCSQKIDLCQRAMGLKKLLSDKELEYKILQLQERRVISGLAPLNSNEVNLLIMTPDLTPASSTSSKFQFPPDVPDIDDQVLTTDLHRMNEHFSSVSLSSEDPTPIADDELSDDDTPECEIVRF